MLFICLERPTRPTYHIETVAGNATGDCKGPALGRAERRDRWPQAPCQSPVCQGRELRCHLAGLGGSSGEKKEVEEVEEVEKFESIEDSHS